MMKEEPRTQCGCLRSVHPSYFIFMLSPTDILGPGGRIAARLPNYERRRQQLAMAEAVDRAIQQRHHLVVEAGTGVGKSFAYLVPAILAAAGDAGKPEGKNPVSPARKSGQSPLRVVISTHTISLQEQLIEKDLPLLRSVIPVEFSAVLVKGRGNYLSRRRLDNALSRAASLFDSDEEFEQLRRLRAWSEETGDGSLSDLDFRPLPAVWDEVQSDHGNCMGRSCPSYAKCFYYKARRRVQNAQILVVNHALFFTDLALRRENVSILPDHGVVVFDEAHMIEAVAGDHMGLSISNSQVEYTLRKLYNDRTNRGLLVHHKLGDAQKEVWKCRDRAADFFDHVAAWLAEQPTGKKGTGPMCRDQPLLGVRAAGASHPLGPTPFFSRVRQPGVVANPLSPTLRQLVATLRREAKQIDDPAKRQDFTAAANRLDTLAQGIDNWLGQQMPDTVYWIERGFSRSRLRITLAAAPIDVGPVLREQLFTKVSTVVMTSATLATGGAAVARRPSSSFNPGSGSPKQKRSGSAARSITGARPRLCFPRACPTRAATRHATSRWRST